MRAWFAVLGLLPLTSPAAPARTADLIGMIELPPASATPRCGGLSGCDYDVATNEWVAVSDDKDVANVRGYRLRIDYDAGGVRAATFSAARPVPLPTGVAPDLESVRLDATTGDLWYASEGDAEKGAQPAVWRCDRAGRTSPLALPARDRYGPAQSGLRANQAVEGLALSPAGTIWTAPEAPTWEEGPPADLAHGATVWITEQARDGQILREIPYVLEPVPPVLGGGARAANGISEILWWGDELLVLERAGAEFAPGEWRFAARLFWIDPAEPKAKRLCFDFNATSLRVDNLEGLAPGRRLADGRETVVLISDDNFSPHQRTQIWVLALPTTALAESAASARAWDDFFPGVVHDERRIAGFVGPYRWLSNYFPAPLDFEGRHYGSSEAAYHASKFPEGERDEFTRLDPDAAKKLSRRKVVDQGWWDARKEHVMREITWQKYAQNPELAAQLLATGDRQLEEANWWGDKFWGTVDGEGKNTLGLILMETRRRLRKTEASQP